MTDTRRQAAEEWVRSMGYRAMTEPAPPEIEEAHIAGQELGEQREREEVVRELRRLAALWGESQPGASLRQAAERFERGEWKEGKP